MKSLEARNRFSGPTLTCQSLITCASMVCIDPLLQGIHSLIARSKTLTENIQTLFTNIASMTLLPAGSARRAALPVLLLLTDRFWGFSPRRGDKFHRSRWNLARRSGPTIVVDVHSYKNISLSRYRVSRKTVKFVPMVPKAHGRGKETHPAGIALKRGIVFVSSCRYSWIIVLLYQYALLLWFGQFLK